MSTIDPANLPAPVAAVPAPPTVVVVNQPTKKHVRHGLHLVLTILTAGLWLPVWLIIAITA